MEAQEIGFFRLIQIIGDPKKGIPGIIPVSRSVWYDGIKSGRHPAPIPREKFERAAMWRKADILALVRAMEARAA